MRRGPSGAFLLLLGAVQAQAQADVTYAARVDPKNEIYVDVENASRFPVRVTSVVIAYFDRRGNRIEKATVKCEIECGVGGQDVESFGPVDGPTGWATVKVLNVYYDDRPEEETMLPPPAATPTPGSIPPPSRMAASVPPPAIVAGAREALDGYAEWRKDGLLLVDGQRVRLAPRGKFKGPKDVPGFAQIPLGYEVRVRGRRTASGVIEADQVETRENGTALFEVDLRHAFDAMEQQYLAERKMYDEDDNGKKEVYGRLYDSGPQVDRVRGILKRLVPEYLGRRDFRVYVVENKEWNAMAAPNDSIYVFSGLLADMDDDEVAIVLGHELAHATHEHSRKQFKKSMLIQLAAVGVIAVADSSIQDQNKRAVFQVATVLGASAWSSGYGRSHEDQADRVGLRYAREGGFDVSKGPALWNRFAKKYGDAPKFINFFFGDHSVAEDRARNLTREIVLNYSR